MHGARDSLRGMGNVIATQIEALRELQKEIQDARAEIQQQTQGLMRIIDRLDRLGGWGRGEEPAPG
jgi:hypothetical protein